MPNVMHVRVCPLDKSWLTNDRLDRACPLNKDGMLSNVFPRHLLLLVVVTDKLHVRSRLPFEQIAFEQ